MGELKKTQLYDLHVQAGATMVDFGGWEMPVQYQNGIVAEHLYTRRACSLFDVSHMGRLLISGNDRIRFLQHVVTSNVEALQPNKAQYCIIPDKDGSAVDDAYLYRFEEDSILLVVNASNTEKDLEHLLPIARGYDCAITDMTKTWAAIAVQGPESRAMLETLAGGNPMTDENKNSLCTTVLEGHPARIANTGYTGEPIGFEVYIRSEDSAWLWNRLIELGARPAGLGARDTLRLEAGYPLYGHEMGEDPSGRKMPIFAVPLARFAVRFDECKGTFIGRESLLGQAKASDRIRAKDYSDLKDLPRRVRLITLLDRGVMRAGMDIYKDGRHIGWVTSGTVVPYYDFEGDDMTEQTGKRAIGMCYIDSGVLKDSIVEIDVRGKRLKAAITLHHLKTDQIPYARPVLYEPKNK